MAVLGILWMVLLLCEERAFWLPQRPLLIKWTIWGWEWRAISVLDESLQNNKRETDTISLLWGLLIPSLSIFK